MDDYALAGIITIVFYLIPVTITVWVCALWMKN